MASIFEEAIRVLSKTPNLRTDNECKALVPWLRQLSPLLEPNAIDVLINLIRNCRYQRAATDHVLILRGKFTQSYYLIVKGSVSLYLDGVPPKENLFSASVHPSKDPDTGDIPASGTSRSASSTGCPPSAEPTTGDTAITGFGDGEKKVEQRPKLGKFIISYGAGESLFDCSMIHDAKPVGVTAICDKPTHLLFLGNDSMSNDFREILRQEVLHMRSVVQSQPLFSMIPQRLQSLLVSCMRQERFTFDSIVVQQGFPVEKIYFIRSGQAKILIESARHRYQYPHLWPFEMETDVYAQEFQWLRESRRASLTRKYINPATTSFKNHQVTVRRKDGYAGVEKWLKDRVISLCTVSTGEVMGDIELTLGLPTYLQTVKIMHHMTVYSLPVNGLERIIGRSFEQEAQRNETLGDHVHRKLENRMDAKYGQQVPLLKCLHGILSENLKKKLVPTRNNGGRKMTTDLILPPVKRKSETLNKQPYSSFGASFPSSMNLTDDEFSQRRTKCSSMSERIPGQGCSSDLNSERSSLTEYKNQSIFERLYCDSVQEGEGSSRRRTKIRRRAARSVLQLREAIRMKVAEEQFKGEHRVGKKDIGNAKRQALTDNAIQNNELNPGHEEASSMSFVNSPVSNSVMEMSRDQLNNNETLKITKNTLPGISTKSLEEKGLGILQEGEKKSEANSIEKIDISPNTFSSKTRLKSHCNQQDQFLTTKLTPVPEEYEPIQFQPVPNLPCLSNSTDLANNSSRTEKESITSKCPENSKTFNLRTTEASRISQDRDDPTLGETQRENADDVERINKTLQFNHNRRSKMKLPPINSKGANHESSNHFLCELEEKLRQFHQDNLDSQYKYTLKLPSLKRYEEIELEVDGETYDGPRPGGKVLIRKRRCRFHGFFAHVKDHKHIHYHMVDSIPNLPIIDPHKITRNM